MSDIEQFSELSSPYPGSFPAELWARIKLIDAEFQTNVNQCGDRNQAVCESLQRCFDLLATSMVNSVEDLRDKVERSVLQDQLLNIAVDLGCLPEAMAPSQIAWSHREWLNRILDGRITYSEVCLLGSQGASHDPGYVIQKVPETDPVLQSVEALETNRLLHNTPPKLFSMAEIRIHASSAYGVRPEDVTDEQVAQVVYTLGSKYGRILVPVPQVISAAPTGEMEAGPEPQTGTPTPKHPSLQCISRPPGTLEAILRRVARVEFEARSAIAPSGKDLQAEGLERAADADLAVAARSDEEGKLTVAATNLTWSDVEIYFDQEHVAQIKIAGKSHNANYTEMGFADRRGRGRDNPNEAWWLLQEVAWDRGELNMAKYGKQRGRALARMSILNKTLQKYFSKFLPADNPPIRYEKGRGHIARFKTIEANRSEGPFGKTRRM